VLCYAVLCCDVLPCGRCVLALDEVTDPQNLGALIRSFHFLTRQVAAAPSTTPLGPGTGPGVEGEVGVVLCQKNSAPLSPAVSKASSGALEGMDIHSTKNLMKFLEGSRENGWHVSDGYKCDDTNVLIQVCVCVCVYGCSVFGSM
jgi:hypothetical protein